MDGGGIYEAVRKRTRRAFGFPINLHRSATPPRHSGLCAIQRTCEGQRICWVNPHLERRKSTTSCWRTRALPDILSLGPLAESATPRAGSEPNTFRIENR